MRNPPKSVYVPAHRKFISFSIVAFLLLQQLLIVSPVKVRAMLSPSVSLGSLGSAYTQNFDTLVSTGTGTSSNTPQGWDFVESGSGANTTYSAGTGSSNTGDTYSFGTVNTDRALGGLRSGSLIPTIGASFTNNTGGTITSLTVSYTGEQWRLGTSGRGADRIDFQYSTNATTLSNGTWVDVDALDFSSPVTTGTVGALNGNTTVNRTLVSSTITGLNIASGATFLIRWTDFDAANADDGLAIDDFSLTPNGSMSTNPSGAGAANPGSVQAGNATLLTVAVTPGTNPTSTGLMVTGNLLTIGGNAAQQFFDDGTNGDAAAGDNVFSYNAAVASGTSAGGKTLPVSISDAQNRSGSTSISLTVTAPPQSTNPSGTGAANPSSVQAGGSTLLTVSVTPGANPASTGLMVTADLTPVGGAATQAFYDDGSNGDVMPNDNVFSFNATVAFGTPSGQKNLTATISDTQNRSGNAQISLDVQNSPPPAGAVVISQVYGGGGNSGAIYTHDFIEILNRSSQTVTLDNWSVQYTSATGTSWSNRTNFSATLAPGQYYLIRGAAGTSGAGAALPTPNVNGSINLSGTSGKVALVNNTTALTGSCPLGDSSVMDFIGYGTADCSEGDDTTGGDNAAPTLSNATAAIRASDGCTDTDSNSADFTAGTPVPRNSASPAKNCDEPPLPPNESNSTIVISQIYAGGGNSGATYTNDYVELYNRGTTTVNLGGWSLQYAQATGSGWDFTKQSLGGTIAPGQYYLVSLASGGANGTALPPANIPGEINMSATAGKIALVRNLEGLEGVCPLSDLDIEDFVGYGSTANCGEGNRKASSPGSSNALLRKNAGGTDTDDNQADFVAGVPNPRRTAPIVEIGPYVFNTDPRVNSTFAPRDASITVNFTEPVEVTGQWFNIHCVTTGEHNSATIAGSAKTYTITPNVSFNNGEQCTVTIYKDLVRDVDVDDSEPGTDNLPADFVWSFSTSTGTMPPYPPGVHLEMGNPSNATNDISNPNNYLMQKPEFALSYDRDKGTANWVSWHLSDEWVGNLSRFDTFRPDPAVPSDWYRVSGADYSGSGFDRGHMVPNADRDKETSLPINQATFLMTNILPQSPDNNQGPWAAQENYLRTLLPANEIYIIAGGVGQGGTGSNGLMNTIAGGKVSVPSHTWKVALIIPKGDNDLSRVTAATRTIAVLMPNIQGIRNNNWTNYLTTVDHIEALTGYNFFSNLPDAVENSIEAGTNGVNPPGTENMNLVTTEDEPLSLTLSAVSPGNPLTYTIVSQPQNGMLSGADASRVYTPNADFNGSDSFTFMVSDGLRQSNVSTVTVSITEVNDAPITNPDAKTTQEDTSLIFPATDLTANDSAGAANESSQSFTVTRVMGTSATNGTVALENGQITYQPNANYNGPASFEYEVCDNGTTNGALDVKCSIGTVSLTVSSVNDAPVLNQIGNKTVYLGQALVFTASASDIDLPADALNFSLVGAVPAGAGINPSTGEFSWTPSVAQAGRTYTLTVRVSDAGGLHAEEQIQIGVAYEWSNLLAPFDVNGNSVFRADSSIPVKFRLIGGSQAVNNAVAKLWVASVTNGVAGTEFAASPAGNANTGNFFRYDTQSGHYIYNLNTKDLPVGMYQLRIDFGDNVNRTVIFILR